MCRPIRTLTRASATPCADGTEIVEINVLCSEIVEINALCSEIVEINALCNEIA